MGADRRKYVMSVDLAMQREMAYREKLTGKSEQCSSSAVIIPQNDSLPSQVQSSTLTQTPKATQVLILNPRPAPYTGPTPAQTPPHRPNLQHPTGSILNPIPVMMPSLTRTSRPTYLAHQKRKAPIHHPPKRIHVSSPEDFYCNLCQVDCSSEMNLRMHLKGHKHKAMLRNAQAKKVVGGPSEANDKIHCDLCGIWCTDMHAFTLHLNGKNHYLKLRASQEKLKGLDGVSAVA